MNTLTRVIGTILVAAAVTATPAPVAAQTTASFRGTVRDQSGAALPGATVVIKNERTGEERRLLTGPDGSYVGSNLKPSLYTIRASVGQFAPLEYSGLELAAAQAFYLDLELHPEGVTESVLVRAASPTIDLSSARIGANVNQREVQDLPINGRQMSQLYLQAPGTVNSGAGTFGDIRFSGRAVQQNEIRYDGVEGTAIIDASPGNLNGEIASPFRLQSSLENVQEFRVESNSYPAEYGTGTGGHVSVVTKSGSNAVHGSAFYYFRDERFDAPNYFDNRQALPKTPLSLKQFGGSFGGPIARDRAFFFGSYEGYRLDAGLNILEAAPSQLAFQRAVPAIAPLYQAFRGAPGAVVLAGASANPDFDILQLQATSNVEENAIAGRVDFRLGSSWSSYARFFRDNGDNVQPEGVSGRTVEVTSKPANGVWMLQGILGRGALNEFKIGYNAAPTEVNGIAPTVNGVTLSNLVLNISGSVANTGIAGQGSSTGVSIPGGLVRQNSASNGRGAPYDPFSLSFIDTYTQIVGAHSLKLGGEFRMIRMSTDRLGGITYTWANLNAFLANQLQSVQYLGDLSAPSVFNNGATGERHTRQEYYIAFAQDEWRLNSRATVNYGLRYEYYAPLRERDKLYVLFNPVTGVIEDPASRDPFRTRKDNFLPRVSMTYALDSNAKTVLRGGFGLLVGPGQTEDQIQPIESDRVASTISGGAYPVDQQALIGNFVNNPNNRTYQPRAYTPDYNVPERVWQYSASIQRELPAGFNATAAYVGSQGRNLFLRSVSNQIVDVRTNANPAAAAIVIRQFDIVGQDGTIQRPFAEVDTKTSGGRDRYNALQLSLGRRFNAGLTMNSQYTVARSYGNTAGSNEAVTSGNNAVRVEDFDYDIGYNTFDVRHAFNVSALYSIPFGRGRRFASNAAGVTEVLLGGWDVGTIVNARSGLPVQVQVTRPDLLYRDTANGAWMQGPCATCVAVVNTPGGGASRNVRRPDMVPGVNPYVKDGLQWLNPAAFAIPEPGTFGNMQRGSIRGPNFVQTDLLVSKKLAVAQGTAFELRWEVYNIFNRTNFANPPAQMVPTIGLGTNQAQPGQPLTQAQTGATFGVLNSTLNRTVGLGTNRQMQFALRIRF
ncbi:MAG TPA: TonB-dependent receptor [Vicinamibacterales bacterium]|nr:TonB-dependent receptor [Vicinamibacterales bacterium]